MIELTLLTLHGALIFSSRLHHKDILRRKIGYIMDRHSRIENPRPDLLSGTHTMTRSQAQKSGRVLPLDNELGAKGAMAHAPLRFRFALPALQPLLEPFLK